MKATPWRKEERIPTFGVLSLSWFLEEVRPDLLKQLSQGGKHVEDLWLELTRNPKEVIDGIREAIEEASVYAPRRYYGPLNLAELSEFFADAFERGLIEPTLLST